jgi:hypothetical protein
MNEMTSRDSERNERTRDKEMLAGNPMSGCAGTVHWVSREDLFEKVSGGLGPV